MSNPDQSPAYWARKDGMKAMSDDEKQGWIESGNSDIADEYSIPLYTECPACGGHGVVGRAPDDYFPCPSCTPAEAAAMAATVPHEKLTHEIDMVLTDPDTKLSPGAVRALQWCRTWVSVPLQLAQAAPKGDSNG